MTSNIICLFAYRPRLHANALLKQKTIRPRPRPIFFNVGLAYFMLVNVFNRFMFCVLELSFI